jgi:hypothetical protein
MSSNFFLLAQQLESSYGRVWSEMPGIRYSRRPEIRGGRPKFSRATAGGFAYDGTE